MKKYWGILNRGVYADFKELYPQQLNTPFDWGNGNTPGARSLAFSILLDWMPSCYAVAASLYASFACDVVGNLKSSYWQLEEQDLNYWVLKNCRHRVSEPLFKPEHFNA